jgi:hypothetical protein
MHFHFLPYRVDDILIVHVQHCCKVGVHLRQRADEFYPMPLPFVSIENPDTDHHPASRSSPISLAQSLCLDVKHQNGEVFQVPKSRPKEEIHFLYHLQHCTGRLLGNSVTVLSRLADLKETREV